MLRRGLGYRELGEGFRKAVKKAGLQHEEGAGGNLYGDGRGERVRRHGVVAALVTAVVTDDPRQRQEAPQWGPPVLLSAASAESRPSY
jgi:hypothetical protein